MASKRRPRPQPPIEKGAHGAPGYKPDPHFSATDRLNGLRDRIHSLEQTVDNLSRRVRASEDDRGKDLIRLERLERRVKDLEEPIVQAEPYPEPTPTDPTLEALIEIRGRLEQIISILVGRSR